MRLKAIKVSELNSYIKRLLASDPILYNLSVEGEISNYRHHQNGHIYFTIKDDKARLRCIMFNEYVGDDHLDLKSGDEVLLSGYVSVYDREGTYQLYVKTIEKKGIGELYESFEKLKKKLEKAGLFDNEKKKPLPFMPRRIGVITSSTGAAVRDIVTTIKRRMNSTDIVIYETMVQGVNAPKNIARGIKHLDEREDIELLILARGGGSVEELWAFNEPEVIYAVFESKTPIISAIGHETDFTISDFVSDVRASTPSVAGEIAVPSKTDIQFKLDALNIRLRGAFKKTLEEKQADLRDVLNRLEKVSPKGEVQSYRKKTESLLRGLVRAMHLETTRKQTSLDRLGDALDALSPLSTLKRGYSLVTNSSKTLISSVYDTKVNDTLSITLRDGKLKVGVLEIKKEEIEDE